MDIIRAIIGFVVIIGLALLLGKTQKARHPGVHVYSWLGAITLLLIIRWLL